MAKFTQPSRQDRLEKILKRVLGNLLTWVEPQLTDTVGPYRPDEFSATTR